MICTTIYITVVEAPEKLSEIFEAADYSQSLT